MEPIGVTVILVVFSVVACLAAVIVTLGLSRIELSRKSGPEGIEDPEAAHAYNRISRWPQFRLLRYLIVTKLTNHKPSGMLADIGCGPGYLTTLIAQKHSSLRVVGVDASEEMIRAADMNATSAGLTGQVEFRVGDVMSLPIPDSTIDFAVSTFSLHHWPDPACGLTEIHRVLKDGGQLLLFDLRRDPCRFFYWLMRFATAVVVPSTLRRINEPLGSALSSYTAREIHGLLESSPFKGCMLEGGAGWIFAWATKPLSDAA